MSRNEQNTKGRELEDLITRAIKKLGVRKENDICRYLPIEAGGYIHHFTMRKMKNENPGKLVEMIEQFIVKPQNPQTVPPKRRAARGSRKRRDQFLFSQEDINRLRNMAVLAGDKEMINKLTPKKDLTHLKKELISSIRQETVRSDLWAAYVESISVRSPQQEQEAQTVRISS